MIRPNRCSEGTSTVEWSHSFSDVFHFNIPFFSSPDQMKFAGEAVGSQRLMLLCWSPLFLFVSLNHGVELCIIDLSVRACDCVCKTEAECHQSSYVVLLKRAVRHLPCVHNECLPPALMAATRTPAFHQTLLEQSHSFQVMELDLKSLIVCRRYSKRLAYRSNGNRWMSHPWNR